MRRDVFLRTVKSPEEGRDIGELCAAGGKARNQGFDILLSNSLTNVNIRGASRATTQIDVSGVSGAVNAGTVQAE